MQQAIKELKVAREQGTPLYFYDLTVARAQARKLRTAFTYPRTKIMYALKANYNREVVLALKESGFGIDAVSAEEIRYAMSLGYKSSEILFTANNTTRQELNEVVELGVLCNIDSLPILSKYGEMFPGSEVCLRVNPEIAAGSHKSVQTAGAHVKFGLLPEQVKDALEIAHKFGLRIIGMHEHVGSGILDYNQYIEAAKQLLNLLSELNLPDLKFVDFGGGLGVPYRISEKPLDTATLGCKLSQIYSEFCKNYGRDLELYLEPGKYLVAECGTLLVEVSAVRENRGRLIAGTNSGFNHLIRPVLYGAYHEIENLTNPTGVKHIYDVVGNVCETGDYFAEARVLPELREGDILAIRTAGAYGASMASNYNMRALPREVAE